MGQTLTKIANFGSAPFQEILESFKKFSSSVFVCQSTTSGEDFGNIGPYIGGVRAQKPPKNGYFVDAESVRKTLEIFNLTTTNALTDETSHDEVSS